MSDYDYQQAVMDDDGAGSAIISTPEPERLLVCACGCGNAIRLDARIGWVPAKPVA